jgi:hypothetical protein
MRLAIADPPYPPNLLATGHGAQPRATRWYGAGSTRTAGGNYLPGDVHPAAAEWDDPARHRALLADLVAGYDGWAIATTPDAVAAVYPPLPVGTRLLVWHKLRAIPTGARIASGWEAVLLDPPAARRAAAAAAQVSDVLRCAAPTGAFAGAKPFAWTRWVLDALGYDQDTDTVDDLFPGSGAVGRAVDQQALWNNTPETF